MKEIKYYLKKYKYYIIISILIILIIILLLLKLNTKETMEIEKKEVTIENKEEIKEEKIRVDIKGFVNSPGVYELDSNSRVIDVINKAGGLKDEASTEYINLSKKVEDEMIIIIYSSDELNKFKETEKNIIYIKYQCDCPDNINDACINTNDKVNTNGVEDKKDEEESKKTISINSASLEELMTISGLGESKAKAIIDYREENGEFKNIEDIKNVSGIGDALYKKIKDYIKL